MSLSRNILVRIAAGCVVVAMLSTGTKSGVVFAFLVDKFSDGCSIKANIQVNGDKLYYLPNDTNYSRVRVERWRGDKWLCTEQGAISAGWRRAPPHAPLL